MGTQGWKKEERKKKEKEKKEAVTYMKTICISIVTCVLYIYETESFLCFIHDIKGTLVMSNINMRKSAKHSKEHLKKA